MVATQERTVLEMPREPWVGLKELAQHLGFSYAFTRKLVLAGKIPGGESFQVGKNAHWRFKLSEVDAALTSKTA